MRENMKIRSIALAGTAAVALSTPALADYPGWYLGFGAGYDQLQTVHARTLTTPSTNILVSYSGDVIYLASAGYKWDSGIRAELELGFDSHDASKASEGGPAGRRTAPPSSMSFTIGTSVIAGVFRLAAASASATSITMRAFQAFTRSAALELVLSGKALQG
jgi:opacity protein-like surface antigen